MKKRLTAILLSLCLVLTLLPVAAFAADGDTVYVGGIALTGSADAPVYALTDDTGAVTTAGASADNYNIAWDGSTLTLNNATVTQGAHGFEDGAAAAIYCETDLTIEPVGTNTVIGPNGNDANGIGASFGIFVGGSLTASGDGALDISGGTVEASENAESTGIYAYRVTVSAGTVTAKGDTTAATGEYGDAYSSGIHTYDAVIIRSGAVNAAGGKATATGEDSHAFSSGIESDVITVTGGTVIATGGAATALLAESNGIGGVNITINSGAVNATGGEADSTGEDGYAYSDGIVSGAGVTVTGGTVKAAGGFAVSDGSGSDVYSSGIAIYGDIVLSGGNVAAVGYTAGLYCEGNVIVRPENTAIGIKTLDDCIFHADTLTPAWEQMDADATQIDGSPFTEETVITDLVAGEKYFYSEVVEIPDPLSDMYVGGIALTGSADAPAYALTDDTGAVTTAGASADNYNIAWDGSTLTLDNAAVTQGAHEFVDGAAAAIYCETDLTIEPVGTNTVIGPNGDDANGIGASFGVFVGGSLTVSGDGALDISGGTVEASENAESTGVLAYRVTVSAGTVTAKGGAAAATGEYGDAYSSGIYTYDGVIIEGGKVTAAGGEATGAVSDTGFIAFSSGIHTINSNVTISGGEVNAAGGKATAVFDSYSIGICFNIGNVIIEGGSVTATGGEATATGDAAVAGDSYAYSKGIYFDADGNITISGGEVNAAGGTATAQYADSCGIGGDGITIRSGAVNATGGKADSTGEGGYAYSDGIYSAGGVTVTGGTVTAAGGLAVDDGSDAYSYGIETISWVNYGDILLSGGNVAAVGYTAGLYCEWNVIVRPENTAIGIKTLNDCIFHADTLTPAWEQMHADATEIDGSPFTEETVTAGTLTDGKQYFSATATALEQEGPVVAKSRAQVKMTATSDTTVADAFTFRVISTITDADWDAYSRDLHDHGCGLGCVLCEHGSRRRHRRDPKTWLRGVQGHGRLQHGNRTGSGAGHRDGRL